jgi:hypothetical protein
MTRISVSKSDALFAEIGSANGNMTEWILVWSGCHRREDALGHFSMLHHVRQTCFSLCFCEQVLI